MKRQTRAAAAAVAAVATLGLTGCNIDPSAHLYREMHELTDQKLAHDLEYSLTRVSDLMFRSVEAREFSPEELDNAFVNVVLDYQDTSPPPIPQGRALYDLEVTGDQASSRSSSPKDPW
ncbi:hypothetical protein [Microbacterium sp. F2]|uniref:hypothetical protein n=1 Tax=Microbacterium sp. F2 TaxID=3422228 RepID=UPI003FD2C19A